MKTKVAIHVNWIWFSLAVVLAALFLSAPAQAGRNFQPSASSFVQTAPPAISRSDAAQDSAAALRGDEYRLIFPTSYNAATNSKESETEAIRAAKFNSFVELLNTAGAQGYRLTSFVYKKSGVPVGVVRRNGARYEYKWFEVLNAARFDGQFAELSQKGFRLADYIHFDLYCNSISPDGSPTGTECATVSVFLLEREVGVEKPARFAVLGWEEKPVLPAKTEVKRNLSQGLFPKQVFAGYDIWFDERGATDRSWSDAEIELVWYDPSWWGSDTNRSVNKLARQGYRVGLINWDTALMYRSPGSASFNYYWVDANKKSFEKQLAQLQAKGATYISTYEEENKLIFERSLSDGGKRHEYKVLKFDFQFEEHAGANKVSVDFAAQGKEALTALHDLVRKGFAVRDLFVTRKQVGAILERTLSESRSRPALSADAATTAVVVSGS